MIQMVMTIKQLWIRRFGGNIQKLQPKKRNNGWKTCLRIQRTKKFGKKIEKENEKYDKEDEIEI